MTLGVSGNYRTGALVVHKRNDRLEIEGEAPDLHTFPRTYLERELNKSVRIMVWIPTDPPLRYEVTSFTPEGEIVATRLPDLKPKPEPPAKRRWWQRKKK